MRGRPCFAALAIVAAALSLSPTAAAAPAPGTPIAVAPGVPGHGRAWELITSPDVVSAQLLTARALSASGDRLFYVTIGPLPGAPADTPVLAPSLAVRGGDGWESTPVPPPVPLTEDAAMSFLGPEALTPDLASSIWVNDLQPTSDRGLFSRDQAGRFELLAEIGPGGQFEGASEDLRHVVFTTSKHLLPADASRVQGRSVYEVDGSGLRLVDVDDGGSLLSDCGSAVPSADAVSRDGRRIYFTTRPACGASTRVFLREDGTATREISASRCDLANCGPEGEVSFVGTTPSGGDAFLVTAERLTDDDPDSSPDLYRYDVGSGKLTLLSAPEGVEVAVTTDPVQASTDGSRVYFRAKRMLGPGEEEGPALYLADASGTHLVSPFADPFLQASADGRYVLFSTRFPLGDGDTDESVDIYRYDAGDRALIRVSAGIGGAGNAPLDAEIAPEENFVVPAPSQPFRAISEDGGRVFFSTAEQLLPADRNQVTDVYEWAQGSLGLISAGAGGGPALYFGASPDGRTALFRTSATLLPRDRDGGDFDFYAARVDGGFVELPPPAGCGAGSCGPSPAPRIARSTPASARAVTRIRLRRPSPAACRQIVATGRIVLLVEAPRPGRLSARARTRIGGRSQTVASARVAISQSGPVRLQLPLSGQARRTLAAGRTLQVHLRVHLSGLPSASAVDFELRPAR
jgi:hypothetical protein